MLPLGRGGISSDFYLQDLEGDRGWQVSLFWKEGAPRAQETLRKLIWRFQGLRQRESRCRRIAWRGAAWRKLLGVLLLLAEHLETRQVLVYAARWSARLVEADYSFIRLYNPSTGRLDLVAAWGVEPSSLPREVAELPVEETPVGQAFREGRPVVWVPSATKFTFSYLYRMGIKSGIILPIKFRSEVLGTISVYNGSERSWQQEEVELLRAFGISAGLAVRRTLTVQRREELYRHLLEALSLAFEARDPYTLGHSWRVAVLARRIALDMGLPRDLADKAYLTGLVHDIGKIAVRDSVLTKPGPLNAEEWEEIKKHPVVGAEILARVGMEEDIVLAVRHHHEDISGSGYPAGLKGGEIPVLARVIRVADTYDALTSRRPYREAWAHEAALREIRRQVPGQLDAKVVQTLVRIPKEHIKELFSKVGGGGGKFYFGCR
ncbi:HD domain-containing phosphohydrolase [Desulfothermobacter acidiphilus]|uniref:HD domain-containing phosphohydrolase n=1 Tax=Desulfothermobacter acidiphilus TaxID=1938353 RepID=UPI003F8AB45B